jgi:3-deoxy-D-arabino-heptulosonate 7-phosphate (DAHP) synthase
MAEPGKQEGVEKLQGGVYKKREKPIDISKATVGDLANLNQVAKRSGIDFPLDGDDKTVTPERFVVIPKK